MDASAANARQSRMTQECRHDRADDRLPEVQQRNPIDRIAGRALIAATRQQYEQRLSEKDADIARREDVVRDRERQVLEGRRALDQQVATQVEAQLKLER